MTEIVYKDESYAIIGACFEVYNEMGPVLSSLFIRSVLKSNSVIKRFHLCRSPRLSFDTKGRY